MTTPGRQDSTGGFDHCALVVEADDDIQQLLLPHLRRRLAADQTVLMVVSTGTEAAVRDRLGPAAHALQWAPLSAFYQRTGFTYSRFLSYLQERNTHREVVHIVAEPDVATDPRSPVDRAAAYLSYEAMASEIKARFPGSITCIWHRRRHPASLIDDVRKVHRRELTARGSVDNPGYVTPGDYLREHAYATMTPVPAATDIDLLVHHPGQVADCRAAVARWATAQHFLTAAVRQVVTATSEVVVNGIRHGRPPVRMRAWHQDSVLIVHVEDRGGRPIPVRAGYKPPLTPADSAGLWIARQLADVLLTHTSSGRTSVRMYFPYAVTHRNLRVPT
ncbi:MEDS domain-containing protein [Actinoplanes sp. N902-109]|uniref:MEDS domain-containing protein n=1 Tax=Actinoplanes sp. (strain N902-109) TaxID=649831 RepID=UPI0003294987|nr:MEDS domain-containing protein [Actinoplanes sp. N902-109]AGL16520.1 hypothetical protein L083_3010 [Actinoplanes sp. N902-109]